MNKIDNIFIYKYTGLVLLFVNTLYFDRMSDRINFRVNIGTNTMLSITPCKKCCINKSVSSFVEYISLNIKIMKRRDRK